MCGGQPLSVPKTPPWALSRRRGAVSSPEGLAPRPRFHGGRGPPGQGVWLYRGESCGSSASSHGNLQALPGDGLWGCGGDQDLLGGCPHLPQRGPLPLQEGVAGLPGASPRLSWRLCPRRPGWGPAGGNQMLRPHSWEQSAAARSAGLSSPFVSPLPGFLRAPPPHPPHLHLPGRTKAAPAPEAPTSGSPQTRAPLPSQLASSLTAIPKLSKWPLSICSDGRDSGRQQLPQIGDSPPTARGPGPPRAPRRGPQPGPRLPGPVPPPPLASAARTAPLPAASPPPGPRRPASAFQPRIRWVLTREPLPRSPRPRVLHRLLGGGPGEGEALAGRSSGLFHT